MFADPRAYPPKPCAHCGTMMACGDTPHDKSNWPRKRYCSTKCKRAAFRKSVRLMRERGSVPKKPEVKPAATPKKPITQPEKPKKASRIEIRESTLDYIPEGSSRSLRASLTEAFRLHPDLGVMLSNPESTWGFIELGGFTAKST